MSEGENKKSEEIEYLAGKDAWEVHERRINDVLRFCEEMEKRISKIKDEAEALLKTKDTYLDNWIAGYQEGLLRGDIYRLPSKYFYS